MGSRGSQAPPPIHFLGIGTQRSATTWLDRNLRMHPQVWMPPIKELHYFDRFEKNSSDYLQRDGRWEPLRLWNADVRHWWGGVGQRVRRAIRRGDSRRSSLHELAWLRRFYLGHPKDMAWYRGLFAPAAGRLCGEITPAYCMLDETTIGSIHAELPDLRILFRMRDPIDRAFSHLALMVRLGTLSDRMSDAEKLEFLLSPPVQRRGDYLGTLGRWQKHFPADRILVSWYDEVEEDPQDALDRVFAFLELPGLPKSSSGNVKTRANVASRDTPPASLLVPFARHMRPQIAALADHFGHYALRWLARCDELASG